jgi:hypothetical protein
VRILSLNFRKALFAQESDDVPIFLAAITHPLLPETIYLSSDPTERLSDAPLLYGTQSRGNVYKFIGMDITIPDEEDKNPPASKLVVSNATRDLIPLARSVSTPAKITIEAVLSSAVNDVEFSIPRMDMVNVQYNASELTFSLSIDALTTEPYPAGSFDPSGFPGLFY